MRSLIIILVAFFTISSTKITHESISATFNIIERGHVLLLEIDFDEENYIKYGETNSLKVTKEDFTTYLNKTTSWKFDGKEIIPQVLSLKSNREHIKVICFLSKVQKNIKKITVKNDFLIDVKEHSNILKVDINDSYKDFRMHKERRLLEVEF